MKTVSINLTLPENWSELSDKQLRYIFQLLATDTDSAGIKTLALLKWSDCRVIGRQDTGSYLLRKGKILFEMTPLTIAEHLSALDWIDTIPSYPVRISRINRREALPADFSEVPFETFIICDNLYQGYLATKENELLDELGSTLYGKNIIFKPYERISVLYWFASLKDYFARKFPDFFQNADTAQSDNLLGSTSADVESAMNAQIRALTKGDITKESLILAMDTHRALTELNAQAREYRQIKEQSAKP